MYSQQEPQSARSPMKNTSLWVAKIIDVSKIKTTCFSSGTSAATWRCCLPQWFRILWFFVVLACHWPVLGWFHWTDLIKPMSTVLSSVINKCQQHQEKICWERWEPNPGLLGEKQVCYLCAIQPPSSDPSSAPSHHQLPVLSEKRAKHGREESRLFLRKPILGADKIFFVSEINWKTF